MSDYGWWIIHSSKFIAYSDKIQGMIDILRRNIHDTKETIADRAFTDIELLEELWFGLNVYSSTTENLADVPEAELNYVIEHAWIELCYILAADNARYFKLDLKDLVLDKGERVDHYLAIAKAKREYLEDIRKNNPKFVGGDPKDPEGTERSGNVLMSDMYRFSNLKGKYVPYTNSAAAAKNALLEEEEE